MGGYVLLQQPPLVGDAVALRLVPVLPGQAQVARRAPNLHIPAPFGVNPSVLVGPDKGPHQGLRVSGAVEPAEYPPRTLFPRHIPFCHSVSSPPAFCSHCMWPRSRNMRADRGNIKSPPPTCRLLQVGRCEGSLLSYPLYPVQRTGLCCLPVPARYFSRLGTMCSLSL